MSEKTIQVTFTQDQLCALHELLSLVHYDNLASEWRAILPPELLEAMRKKVWQL